MRVAVVGAGAAGSACAWQLLTSKAVEGLSVTVFEMGRGAGGRAGTRRVPQLAGLHVNHGAPLFHIPSSDAISKPLISALVASGHLNEWHGTFGGIDAKTGALGMGGASRGELLLPDQKFHRYSGVPGMSALAKGSLELAREANNSALEVCFETRVKEFKPRLAGDSIVGWEILDKDGKSFGDFDWVVMAGATPALARWRDGFKEEPPVLVAAQTSGSKLFQDIIAHLDRPLSYEQTHIVMLAWDVSGMKDGAEVLQILRQLPFDITDVSNDEALAKISRQSMGPSYAIIALHSTIAFAQKHKKVMGSGSYVSVANNVAGSVDAEGAVSEELAEAFQSVLGKLGAPKLPRPAWGPALHRWGAAFPHPELDPMCSHEAWMLPQQRFAFAGDFVTTPYGCVATALRSGLAAGESLLRHSQGHEIAAPMLQARSSL